MTASATVIFHSRQVRYKDDKSVETAINELYQKAQQAGKIVGCKGCTKLEYLESTGTQYIDTMVKGNINTKLEIKVYINEFWNNRYSSIFGNFDDFNNSLTLYVGKSTGNFVNRFGFVALGNYPTAENNEKYIISYDRHKLIINSDIYEIGAENIFNTKGNLYAFGRNVNNNLGEGTLIGRIYFLKLYDNNDLVRDFIPALDKDKRPCMFDKVSKTCFYNQGTGEFLYG